MKNISVVVTPNNSITVVADSGRFGKQAIMYEDTSFMRCFDYIRKMTGKNHFRIKQYSCSDLFTDTEGRTMGKFMWVES